MLDLKRLTRQEVRDYTDRQINSFASRSFRDTADGDYIAARMAGRARLDQQYLWSSQQAIEKYLKYLLLVNRIQATDIGHDIKKALDRTAKLPFNLVLTKGVRDFIGYIAEYGEDRYLTSSYVVEGHLLFQLDRTVWELRRYCQVLDARDNLLRADELELLAEQKRALELCEVKGTGKIHLPGGKLERIMANQGSPARAPLIWQNAFFSARRRKVRSQYYESGVNAPLDMFPAMVDELAALVHIPKPQLRAYQEFAKMEGAAH